MMAGYLLDSNHLMAALAPVSALRDRLRQTRRRGLRVGSCMPVLCEIEAGIQGSPRSDRLYRTLGHLLREIKLWPTDRQIARLFGTIYLDVRRRGRSLSHVDIVLAAFGKHMNLTLLTTDRDFEALPEVRTENWLS